MTQDPGLGRRVSRLENDTESIYELLTEVRSVQDDHTRRLDEHSRLLGEHTRLLGEHTRRFDEHTRRFDRIDDTLQEIVRRLPEPS